MTILSVYTDKIVSRLLTFVSILSYNSTLF